MSTQPSPAPSSAELARRLSALTLRDEQRLSRRLDGARRVRKPEARAAVLAEIAKELDKGELRLAARRAAVPEVTYPEQLPVSQKKDEIAAAIRDHQVVIVAGETGSGKTTQIPKICLELGRGVRGLIGHTQPRRIAARTVAERVAEELRTPLGAAVGWKVRFTDQVSDSTLVKLMTDGIMLAEIQTDRELRAYDTIIIDEAHERSLNIDFILGYLAQLLPRRPDLKVVITSATIDPQRFSRHFGDAPVVEVSGRTYPVEVRYRPLLEEVTENAADADRDQISAICDAVDELQAEGPGDILVFLSGEREIRDTADALDKHLTRGGNAIRSGTDILPLYARLSSAEQHRVFQQHSGRRVVLATNVAETSLTVPGIRYVIDPGTARISRYSHRTKVQRLPIERISQASANQRKGRCGRTSDGICIRLYDEDDFLARPEFTDPEILRTNLASVILQMTAAGLGDIAKFPFIDPPDSRNIKDGIQLLEELGALDPQQKDPRKRLTETGRKLAQLPVDPRLARMVLEADRNGCVAEVMVIASALSIQDPRERPADKQAQADQQHARFRDETSDFLAFLNLWAYIRDQQKSLSSSAFRRMCRGEYLNYLRIREWQDIYSQLRAVAKQLGIDMRESDRSEQAADPQRVHASLLAGLLSHLGLKDTDKNEYLGARSAKFAIFPGSALFKKPPRWIMSAELVETSRLWARVNARIEPEWVEPLAQHLVKRTYSEPHWEKDQAAVMAYEKVTLYGVPLIAQRKVNYGRIDPEVSRELFIRNALVEGDWRTHHQFFQDNRKLLGEVEELEHRARRRDILVDDETLFDFYDARLPQEVVSGAHFDSWWKNKRRDEPELLNFEQSMLINENAEAVTKADYPDSWRQGALKFRVTYQFEPGADADGVTVHIPLQVLNQVSADGFDWQIPGLREEVVTELIRSLPKPIRRHYVPAPNYAKKFLDRAVAGPDPLPFVLARELRQLVGVPVSAEDFDLSRVPEHLKITFRVIDERRRKIAEDKDLDALRLRLKPKTREAITRAFERTADPALAGLEQRTGLKDWTVGTLPRTFEARRSGQPVKAYPALVDEGDSVAVRLFDTEPEQAEAMWRGTRRLILLNVPVNPAKFVADRLSNQQKLALSRNPHGGIQALFEDCATAAADRLIAAHGGPAWDETSYRKLYEAVRAELVELTVRGVERVQQVLAAWHSCERRLKDTTSLVLVANLQDVKEQLAALIHPGFVTDTGLKRLPDLMRYLVAIDRRLQQMPTGAARDTSRMDKVREIQAEYADLLAARPPGRPLPPAVRDIRWMIEELRVSYFAHALGTAFPVSDKRVFKSLDEAWALTRP
ncbi:ATP-dependent helicase HrpA [Streptomyces sp. DvalAA-14]|uniref:ATP-dependent RNA helicase HrpA n=1 Tax=unclassified Streptomyces TaxID=2593676 RepID=UPI00081BB293|nr:MULTISPECIES: ATP-dependent RNA helicase HrpA [unclassified Streptomyces]MYS24575.1 ATP-dependent RNA helicase HrpA [Streptomyces sp. SID4948]SCE47353.1 ATP-dependent helicase HrpA [Streptomyces sp. DvalAA-14]